MSESNVLKDKTKQLIPSVSELLADKVKLNDEYLNITKSCYSDLSTYFDLELKDGENPEEKFQEEINRLKEVTTIGKAEIAKLDIEKEEVKAKMIELKEKLSVIESLAANPEGAVDAHSKLNFKEFSRQMTATYKVGDDCKANGLYFKVGDTTTKGCKIDDPGKTKEQKIAEFWRLFDYIDKHMTNSNKIIPN